MIENFDSDIDAQIERCKERIRDGVLPWFFESRLEGLKGLAEVQK